jgi:geranylgeranyl pyrophosphate synthase
LGAITAGADQEAIEAISEWAWEMGIVFQMTDDVLDLVADESFLGKAAGSDIGEGVYTLPVILAANGPDGREVRELLETDQPVEQGAIDRVIALAVSGGYVDQVLDEAIERIRIAEKAANRIPESDLSPVLRNLDRYILDRVTTARS